MAVPKLLNVFDLSGHCQDSIALRCSGAFLSVLSSVATCIPGKIDWVKPLDDQTIRFDEFRLS